MKEIRKVFLVLILICVNAAISIGQDKISSDTISAYFGEIKANTGNYRSLWNIDLYGPILLVDPKTRVVYSNFPDSTGILKQDGGIITGILPIDINVANTAITWSGRTWAMIMLPLPSAKSERLDLLSHELFHSSQPLLGFKIGNPSNSHLDQKDGRIYLRLELEALQQAVGSESQTEISRHLSNALSFRNHRYAIYKDAKASENSLELNEGLATYTGIFMSGRDDNQIKDYLRNKIVEFQDYPTFVRSFAYLTIPFYGNLLSKYDKYWNHQTDNNTNLTDFFIKSFGLEIPDNPGEEIMVQYGLLTISAEETKREERIRQLISDYKAKFIEQPHLVIRFEKMSVSFDPRNIMPIEGFGTVYPTMRVSDNWGILTVTGGALLGTNWDKITLSEPTLTNGNKVAGDGWTIDLNSGYSIEKSSHDKNYSIRKQ